MDILTQPCSKDIAVKCHSPAQAYQSLIELGIIVASAHRSPIPKRNWYSRNIEEDWEFVYFMNKEDLEVAYFMRVLELVVVNKTPRIHGSHLIRRPLSLPDCITYLVPTPEELEIQYGQKWRTYGFIGFSR